MDRRLTLILATMFLDILGVGIIIPVAPFYATAYGASALEVGLLFTFYSAAQFLATPVLGGLSDRYGRRSILLVSLIGEVVGYLLMGFANSLAALYVARLVTGATAGNIGAAQAYLADITPREHRTRTFGLAGAAFGAGFLFGPAFGGALSLIDLRLTAFAAAGLIAVNVIFVALMLPESLPVERRSTAPLRTQLNPLAVMLQLVQRPILRAPLLVMFLLNGAFTGMQANLAVFLNARFGFGPIQVAPLFVALALTGVFMQAIVVRKLSELLEDSTILLLGVIATTSAFALIAVALEPWLLFPSMALLSAGNALWRAPLASLITKLVSEREQGMANGGSQSTAALAAVVGPVGSGFAYESVADSAPYFAGAVSVLLAGLVMAIHRRTKVTFVA
ncbi:MAG TPA: MFS transporter [Chloroflexota bacterium]